MASNISHNGDIMKISAGPCSIILCFLFVIVFAPNSSFADEPADLRVSFSLSQTPIKNVIKMISQQTGYSVYLDEDLEHIKISGDYNSIKLESFLNRAMKGSNSIFIISDKEKTIHVRTAVSGSIKAQPKTTFIKNASIDDNSDFDTLDNFNNYKTSVRSYSKESYGGIHELDNNFPVKKSRNNDHIIDPQTGKTWEEAEKTWEEAKNPLQQK